MLSNVYKNILLRALVIRKGRGEDPEKILKGYQNLTEEEKAELLELLEADR